MSHLENSIFLANISHEMRTPLNVILGFSKLLNDRTLTPSDQKDFIKLIEKNSEQLLKLVDDILDFSKVESGNMSTEKIGFSLIGLLHELIGSMRGFAEDKNIVLELHLKTAIPEFIHSDPTRIRQILNNMVSNAIKFTSQGAIQIFVSLNGTELEIEVLDTGCGIKKEQQLEIFQPFKQANSAITRQYGGSGLGLVLTRKLCEALHGQFYLKESHWGVGSSFIASIQVQTVDTTNPHDHIETVYPFPQPERSQLRNMKVLLVEDCPDNQTLFSIFLKRHEAEVLLASDGQEGLEKALVDSPDLVLMDIQMPKMDGFAVVHQLRTQRFQRPIIALTAHSRPEDREKCIRAGFTDFLSKPLQEEELIRKIQYHLGADILHLPYN